MAVSSLYSLQGCFKIRRFNQNPAREHQPSAQQPACSSCDHCLAKQLGFISATCIGLDSWHCARWTSFRAVSISKVRLVCVQLAASFQLGHPALSLAANFKPDVWKLLFFCLLSFMMHACYWSNRIVISTIGCALICSFQNWSWNDSVTFWQWCLLAFQHSALADTSYALAEFRQS